MKTFIIAEAGANHNRDWKTATRLVDAAVEAGADAVKFQTYSAKTLYTSNTPDFANYRNINKLIESLELPREWQKDLKCYCDESGIEFMSTPFDERAILELVEIGVKRMKIAGFESTDPRFVELVAATKLPIIMSAGIGFDFKYWGMYRKIFETYNNHVTVLHCNNAYPTPMEDANLKNINDFQAYKSVDAYGFSDHTESTFTPALAVARGATVIEKHFTLSKSMKGPDHPFALEPDQLKEMVFFIREAEKTLGTKLNTYTESEKSFSKARRSVVTTTAIKKGEVLTSKNITTKRPLLESSIPAIEYFNLLGKRVTENIEEDTPIDFKCITG